MGFIYVCIYEYIYIYIYIYTHTHTHTHIYIGFPGGWWLSDKNPPASAGDVGLIPGSGRSPGEGNDIPLQYFCLDYPWTEEPGGLQSMESQKSRT